MVFLVGRSRNAVDAVRVRQCLVLAIEWLAACQGLDLRDGLKTSAKLVSWLKCARTALCSTSSRSRAKATVSAVSGMPGKPRNAAIAPS